MSISKNIKTLRESHGMSQTEFGHIAGVSDKAVSTWENGLKVPRMGAVQKLSDYFGIPKSMILDEDSELAESPSGYVNSDPELTAYLEELRTRPEMRMLFSVAKGASKEDVEKAVAIIEALRKTEGK